MDSSDVGPTSAGDDRRQAAITFSVDHILGRREEDRGKKKKGEDRGDEAPAWVHCSRFSARPTAGPRRRSSAPCEDRRFRAAFSAHQVSVLRAAFDRSEYLSECDRSALALELGLSEAQVKIWFQNARAKRKRSQGGRTSPLAKRLAEAGLYNHCHPQPPS